METNRKQQIIEFVKEHKFILLIATVFFLSHFFFLDKVFTSDEGTHTLISIFYKDLITFIPTHLSVSQIYDYAINYLVHYPKLSIYYPPLFHITGSILFFIKSDYVTLRILSLTLGTLSVIATYFLTMNFTKNKKTSLIASALLATSPLINILSVNALTDNMLLFAGILILYLWYNYIEKDSPNIILLTLASIVLVFARQQMVLIFVPLFVYALMYKKWKKIIIPFIIISAFFGAYYLGLYKLGVLQASLSAEVVASYENDPLFTQIGAWIYYPSAMIFNYLIFPISIIGFFGMYKWFKSREKWQILLLILFFTNLLFFIFIPNKDIRFVLPIIITLSIASADVLKSVIKKKQYILAFAIYLIAVLTVFVAPVYLEKGSSYSFMDQIEKLGDVAILSENSNLYSSNIMAAYASTSPMDKSFYRPCAFFDNKTLLQNMRYAIVIQPVDENFKEDYTNLIDYIKADTNFTKIYSENGTISVDVYENNNHAPLGKNCNYICITQEEICSKM